MVLVPRSMRPFAVMPSEALKARASASSSVSWVSWNGAIRWLKPSPGPCITSTNPYSVIACSSLASAGALRMRKSVISAVPLSGLPGAASS